MKALITFLPLAGALVACQTANVEHLSYGSQLDGVRMAAPAEPAADSPPGRQRAASVVQAREQAQALRTRLALEPDRVARIDILAQLQELGDTLRRLQAGAAPDDRPSPLREGAGAL